MMLARACTFRPAVAAMRPMAAARPLACAPRAACYIKPSTRLMSSAGFDENKYDEHGQVRVAENSRVFIDVSIAGGEPQRMTFELYDDVTPITAENFRMLCTGDLTCEETGVQLHYKGNKFHRIIPDFMIQAGDITAGDGTGGMSVFGPKFRDENFQKKHSEAGILSMANRGRNTNSSQFFITTNACSWLDRKHVVFGEIQDGLATLMAIDEAGSADGTPTATVEIVDCGEITAEGAGAEE